MPVLSVVSFTFGPDVRFSFMTEMYKNEEVDIVNTYKWVGGVWNTNYGTPTIGFGFINFSSSMTTNLLYPPDPYGCWYGDPVITYNPYYQDSFYIVFVNYCYKDDSIVSELVFGKNNGPPNDPSSWTFFNITGYNYDEFKDRPEIIGIPTYMGSRIVLAYMRNREVEIKYSIDGGYSWAPASYFTDCDNCTQGSFAWDGSNLYYAFNDAGPTSSLFYILHSYDGVSWDSPYFIAYNIYSSYSCYNFNRPVATFLDLTACSDGKLAIAYLNDLGGRCNVMVATANTWYGSWDEHIVMPSPNEQIIPSVVCVDPSYLWVIWHERVGYELWNIVARSSPDWGWSWNDVDYVSDITTRFNETPGGYDYNEVVTDNTYLYVSWGNDSRIGRSDVYIDISYPINVNEDRIVNNYIESADNIRIYNVEGRLIFKDPGKTKLPDGVYFIKEGKRIRKIIIRR